jgi:hypothetical protein
MNVMRYALLIPFLIVAACRETPRHPDTTAAITPLPPREAVAPVPDTVAREIYIDSIRATNPLVVYGRARTFENTVQLQVRDSAGAVLARTFTTSVGEMGHHNPYVAELRLARDPGSRVTVEVFEYSANDGSVRSLVSREVPYLMNRSPSGLVSPRSP